MTLGEAINALKAETLARATRAPWAGRYFAVVPQVPPRPGFRTVVFNADGSEGNNYFSAEDKAAEDWELL